MKTATALAFLLTVLIAGCDSDGPVVCTGSNCDRRQADFSNRKMAGSDLSQGYFEKSNFSGADLTGSNLAGGDFRDSNFTGANLSGVNLSGEAYLKGA